MESLRACDTVKFRGYLQLTHGQGRRGVRTAFQVVRARGRCAPLRGVTRGGVTADPPGGAHKSVDWPPSSHHPRPQRMVS